MTRSKPDNTSQATPQTQARRPSSSQEVTLFSEQDLFLFNEGTHFRLYEKLGAHPLKVGDVEGTYFAVWAPNAARVSVIGEFNGWDKASHPLHLKGESGIWHGFFPGLGKGTVYKYHVASRYNGYQADKADPFALYTETPPKTASLVWDLAYEWGDRRWMAGRRRRNALDAPIAIYEVHLGSWRRVPEEEDRPLSYRELAPYLAEYVQKLGFTHVEFLPLTEHPFYGSWGYEVTGYFAPTSRYGTPQDLMYLIDSLHQHGIGVILDCVPAHFPKDEHALGYFDGAHLFEHADPRQGIHPDWDSFIFNYGRNEVRSFLISNALFWLDKYHIDGLRIDAVASMLYLDYSRKDGEWVPNQYGGKENIDAIEFLREVNATCYKRVPGITMIAEESTAWPGVSRPVYLGGLGFGFKWNMGWMHDTLAYLSLDPIYRQFHHNEITFSLIYAFSENFILPLSHDEVVHGKGSLLGKMPGDEWRRFAGLRSLLAYMWAHPGKQLLFMGSEFGQGNEWSADNGLDWWVLAFDVHQGVQRLSRELNAIYRQTPALWQLDASPEGFSWIDSNDAPGNTLSFLRMPDPRVPDASADGDAPAVIAC